MANLCKSDWNVIRISDPWKTALHWHLPRLKHRWNSFPCSSFMRNMKNPKWKWTDMSWHPITVETLEKTETCHCRHHDPKPIECPVWKSSWHVADQKQEAASATNHLNVWRILTIDLSDQNETCSHLYLEKCENAENAQAPRKKVTHHKHSTTNINIMTSRLSQQFPWKFANHPAGWEWSRKALLQYHLRPCEVYTLEILNSKYSKV